MKEASFTNPVQVVGGLQDLQSELGVQIRVGQQKFGQDFKGPFRGIHADCAVQPAFWKEDVAGLLNLFE